MLEDVKKCHTTTSAMLFISEMVNLLMEKQNIWGIAQTKDRKESSYITMRIRK